MFAIFFVHCKTAKSLFHVCTEKYLHCWLCPHISYWIQKDINKTLSDDLRQCFNSVRRAYGKWITTYSKLLFVEQFNKTKESKEINNCVFLRWFSPRETKRERSVNNPPHASIRRNFQRPPQAQRQPVEPLRRGRRHLRRSRDGESLQAKTVNRQRSWSVPKTG